MDVRNFNFANLPALGWNDEITSFRIGKGVRVKLCADSGCRGGWSSAVELVGPYNQPNFNSNNDWATEVHLFPYSAANEKYVQVFGNGRFDADQAGLFTVGEYYSEDIKNKYIDKGGYGGAASSMIIPEGLAVNIFKEDFCQG